MIFVVFPLSITLKILYVRAITISIQYQIGDHDERPWGNWAVLDVGNKFITKRITVNAGARLSLQYHHHREEIWTIVSGSGVASIGGVEQLVSIGDTVSILTEQTHRIFNNATDPLVFIEVQLGEILDENDIVRIEDDFGRPLGMNPASIE